MPGYPHRLDFNDSCSFVIDVDSGSIELTLENVSMPSGSIIAFRLIFLRVGVHPLQSKAAYVKDHKTIVFLRLPKIFTGTFVGI